MLLTIGIPTYNRSSKLVSVLDILYEELKDLSNVYNCKNEIEIIVSNNCSTDDTEKIVLESNLFNDETICHKYNKNKENLGATKNLCYLYKEAQGEYVWLWGDDDVYRKGVVEILFSKLLKREYSYIYMNHRLILEEKNGSEKIIESMINGVDISKNDPDVLLDIFEYSRGSVMFQSASVYKKKFLMEALDFYFINLALPLGLAFYCASKGKINIIEDTYIDDNAKEISWSEHLYDVFCIQIPVILFKSRKLGYNNRLLYKILFKYIYDTKKRYCMYFIKLFFGKKCACIVKSLILGK